MSRATTYKAALCQAAICKESCNVMCKAAMCQTSMYQTDQIQEQQQIMNDRAASEFTGSPVSLYLHLPFCVRKCRYCDFLSGPYDAAVRRRYLRALETEIQLSAKTFSNVKFSLESFGNGSFSLESFDNGNFSLESLGFLKRGADFAGNDSKREFCQQLGYHRK